jgi:hypothetical protein
MTTAFWLPIGAEVVARAKYAKSLDNRHGILAFAPSTSPIPLAVVAATISVAFMDRWLMVTGHSLPASGITSLDNVECVNARKTEY